MNTLTIYTQVTYKDFKQMMLRHNIHYFIFVFMAISILIGNIIFNFVPIKGIHIYIAFGGIFYLLAKPLCRLWRLKKQSMSEDFLSKIEYSFTDKCLRIYFVSSRQEHRLSDIRRAIETKELFVLYVGRASAHVIPKRCITTNCDLLALRQLLQKEVKKTRLKVAG